MFFLLVINCLPQAVTFNLYFELKIGQDGQDDRVLPFNTDSLDGRPVEVYTDGACPSNGNENAKAGYGVWWGDDHPLNLSKKLAGPQTNQRAELVAASAAIQQAIEHNAGTLTLYTDSKYVINCVTIWIANWKLNGWITSGKGPVKNAEDIKRLDSLCSQHTVKWIHVRGHKGMYGNEKADHLARQGVQ